MFGIGAGEFALILIVGLIVFGPSKLPELGRSLGKLLREFKKAQLALTNVVNEVEQAPTKPAAATRSEAGASVQQSSPQEASTGAQVVSSTANSQPATTPNASIEQVTEMINANPIKLTKEPIER